MGKTKKNRSVREELERIYGKKCMIHEGIRRDVKRPLPKKAHYKGKSIMNQLTLHHVIPRRENGATTVENGVVACRACHDWLEQLPSKERDAVNEELMNYKRELDHKKIRIVSLVPEKETKAVAEIELSEITEDCLEIEAETMTAEEKAMYEEYKRRRAKKEFSKFGVRLETPEEKWKREQQEIIEDVLDELRY